MARRPFQVSAKSTKPKREDEVLDMVVKVGRGWWVRERDCSVPGDPGSAEADLAQDALAGEHLGEEANGEAHHGQTAIPGFCEVNEAKTGR